MSEGEENILWTFALAGVIILWIANQYEIKGSQVYLSLGFVGLISLFSLLKQKLR